MSVSSGDIRADLKTLITRALEVSYISESCHDAVQTGNHYQSVSLDGSATEGFRTERRELLDRINFSGKKVLDLGSNLGELSRGARARGARLVDGYEYDSYFVEIANLVNAYNDVSHVSFYERDITDRSIYGERYDLVLAFSVFVYVDQVIDKLAEITDVLVVETHKLVGNLDTTYIRPLAEHFPHHRVLGDTEWGTSNDASVRRAVLVFAKDEALLRATVLDQPEQTIARGESTNGSQPDAGPVVDAIDTRRTCLQERFFERFDTGTPDDPMAQVRESPLDLDALAEAQDAREYGYSGWTYWFLLLRGYLEYGQAGGLHQSNVYLEYLLRYFGPQGHDPGLSSLLEDQDEAMEIVERRFRDLAYFDALGHGGTDRRNAPAPVQLIVSDPPPPYYPSIFTSSGEELVPRSIDGWHRLFAARLFGVERLPCEIVRVEAHVGQVIAAIESFRFDGRRVEVSGWCVSPREPIDSVELTADGPVIARTEMTLRRDVGDQLPMLPHGHRSGFEISAEWSGDPRSPVDFELVPLSAWRPAGRIRLPYLPEMREIEIAPASVRGELVGQGEQTALSAWAARAVDTLESHLGPHRELTSFEATLDWGVGGGLLAPFAARLARGARVSHAGFDRETIERARRCAPDRDLVWIEGKPSLPFSDGSFDLLIGLGTLPHLSKDEQRSWMVELYRVIRGGGYLALSVNGELARKFVSADTAQRLERTGIERSDRDTFVLPGQTLQTRSYTVSTASDWFDLVEYAEGAFSDREDLLLMRKP